MYSHMEANLPTRTFERANSHEGSPAPRWICSGHTRRDFSLFLSHGAPKRNIHSAHGYGRPSYRSYRGAIYALSAPSPTSPSVYAGISNGVYRLDFTSTDDLTGSCGEWYRENASLDANICKTGLREANYGIIQLSGYERPDPETTAMLPLRNQRPYSSLVYSKGEYQDEQSTGWDRRWEKPRKSPLRRSTSDR